MDASPLFCWGKFLEKVCRCVLYSGGRPPRAKASRLGWVTGDRSAALGMLVMLAKTGLIALCDPALPLVASG